MVEAEVLLLATRNAVRTDASGRFRFLDVPAGQYHVLVRAIGYRPLAFTMTVASEEDPPVAIRLEADAARLDPLVVTGEVVVSPEFTRRRQRGLGYFVTAEDLERAGSREVSQYLQRLPVLRIFGELGRTYAVSERGTKLDMDGNPTVCAMRVALDGKVLPEGTSLDILPPSWVGGIEVYAGPASLPAELSALARDARCGLIVLWGRPGGGGGR